jgi:ankyrin repeat protein
MVKFLLEKGAKIHSETMRNLLASVARWGDVDMVKLFIGRGADVNAWGPSNMSPLAEAAKAGHAEVVALLIAKGANVNATDRKGRTVLDIAEGASQRGIVELLKKHGAKKAAE